MDSVNLFNSPYEQYRDLNGLPYKIVHVIDRVDGRHPEECLPMFIIEIDSDIIEAFPEELFPNG